MLHWYNTFVSLKITQFFTIGFKWVNKLYVDILVKLKHNGSQVGNIALSRWGVKIYWFKRHHNDSVVMTFYNQLKPSKHTLQMFIIGEWHCIFFGPQISIRFIFSNEVATNTLFCCYISILFTVLCAHGYLNISSGLVIIQRLIPLKIWLKNFKRCFECFDLALTSLDIGHLFLVMWSHYHHQ